MFCASTGIVRTDWSFDLAMACQRFVGGVLEPEPDELARAVQDLGKALPEAHTQAEHAMLVDRLHLATENAAYQFHMLFHRYVSNRCELRWNVRHRSLSWNDSNVTPAKLLVDWVSNYLAEFAESHDWPAPMRAARVIRTSLDTPFEVDRIARVVGCARSALMRSFKSAYGVSMGEYDARCRIRLAFTLLRQPCSNVGAVAFQVGYQSNKNFYRALKDLTKRTPSSIRLLGEQDAERILNTRLRLPVAIFTKGHDNMVRSAPGSLSIRTSTVTSNVLAMKRRRNGRSGSQYVA